MNTTTVMNETASNTLPSNPNASVMTEVLFFVKSSIAMAAMILLLASAWV